MEPLGSEDPRAVGPYRLTHRLGSGGMGRVYLGESPGGRRVAVKLVREDLASSPGFRERFRREVKLAMRAGGFWTAQVVDADPDAAVPWIASQYVEGPSLAERVARRGPLDEQELRRTGGGLAEALASFHKAGLVHRDLKPSNVLLQDDGPRVIDFGVSKALEPLDTAGAVDLTRAGTILGTPGFMAPEQALGKPAGPSADVFSLGSLLVHAATGTGPFGTGASHALLYRVVYEEPELGGVPYGLRQLIADCLRKDPEERPTAEALVARFAGPGPRGVPDPRIAVATTGVRGEEAPSADVRDVRDVPDAAVAADVPDAADAAVAAQAAVAPEAPVVPEAVVAPEVPVAASAETPAEASAKAPAGTPAETPAAAAAGRAPAKAPVPGPVSGPVPGALPAEAPTGVPAGATEPAPDADAATTGRSAYGTSWLRPTGFLSRRLLPQGLVRRLPLRRLPLRRATALGASLRRLPLPRALRDKGLPRATALLRAPARRPSGKRSGVRPPEAAEEDAGAGGFAIGEWGPAAFRRRMRHPVRLALGIDVVIFFSEMAKGGVRPSAFVFAFTATLVCVLYGLKAALPLRRPNALRVGPDGLSVLRDSHRLTVPWRDVATVGFTRRGGRRLALTATLKPSAATAVPRPLAGDEGALTCTVSLPLRSETSVRAVGLETALRTYAGDRFPG